MAVARGSCPSCGAPIEFSVGASVSRICEHCRSTVYRTDRGLEDLGKVAAIANVPSLIAVGDEGSIGGRPFVVLGRVQLDHGAGPWDEYYVAFDHGAAWGWLAYAEGAWYATALATAQVAVPAFESLDVETDVPLGSAGVFRVAEVKTGHVVSAEGEQPDRCPPGLPRTYADVFGADGAFGTIDYGDRTGPPEVFLGRRFEEGEFAVTKLGPRSAEKVKLSAIRCPKCGGDLPKLAGERSARVGCRYCGAVSDIAAQSVIAEQDAARGAPPIPIGNAGTLAGVKYVCIAHLERSAEFEGERFTWDELLLFSEGVGFRWLVRDDTGWLFVVPVNLAELDLAGMPAAVRWRRQRYGLRNESAARVESVLGEVFWRCEVGETVSGSDYVLGPNVLSREEGPGEVRWSYAVPVPWPVLATAFGVPRERPGGEVSAPSMLGGVNAVVMLIVIAVVVVILISALSSGGGFFGGGGYGSPAYGGSGMYYGGK
jgi:hypothetical protein